MASHLRPGKLAKAAVLCVLATWLMARPGNAVAQASGQVSGVVTDPTGSVISGARIELISAATAQTRMVISGGNGAYLFALVDPGNYQMRTSMAGFQTVLTQNIWFK